MKASAILYLYDIEQEAVLARNGRRLTEAIDICLRCVEVLPQFLKERREITSTPLHPPMRFVLHLCDYLPPLGREDDLRRLLEMFEANDETAHWVQVVRKALDLAGLSRMVFECIEQNPGCIQTELCKSFPGQISSLMYWAAELGIILRERMGRSYRLFYRG